MKFFKKNLKVAKEGNVLMAYGTHKRTRYKDTVIVEAWCKKCGKFNIHGMNPVINSMEHRVAHCKCKNYWIVYKGMINNG